MRAHLEAAYIDYVTAKQKQFRRAAYAICGDWHRADDLVQTAFAKLYVAWPRIQRKGVEDAYVRRILLNAHIDEVRRPAHDREVGLLDGVDRPSPTTGDPELRDLLVAALQRLPVMQRKVVVLRHLLDLDVRETAHELGISAGAVKSHTSRGLERLQELLADEGITSEITPPAPRSMKGSLR